jgi:hypothetical protein
MRRKNFATESESGGGLQGHAVGKLKVYTQATQQTERMKPPRDFVPRVISGSPESTIDKSKREFLRASAALLAASGP